MNDACWMGSYVGWVTLFLLVFDGALWLLGMVVDSRLSRLDARAREAEERLLAAQVEHMEVIAAIIRDTEVLQRLRASMGRERPRA